MDPDNLSGRSLDAAIAQHVFGLDIEERTNTRTGERDYVCREPGKEWLRVAFYGMSLSSSIQVEAALQERGWKRRQGQIGSHWNEPGKVRVVLERDDGRTVEAVGQPDEALCRAALKAVHQT